MSSLIPPLQVSPLKELTALRSQLSKATITRQQASLHSSKAPFLIPGPRLDLIKPSTLDQDKGNRSVSASGGRIPSEVIIRSRIPSAKGTEAIHIPSPMVDVPHQLIQYVPIPVEAETTFEIRVARIEPRYKKVTYPVFIPRFIEVPVPCEFLGREAHATVEGYRSQLEAVTQSGSLCEAEHFATQLLQVSPSHQVTSDLDLSPHEFFLKRAMAAWQQQSVIIGSEATGTNRRG